jgi:hypothetical protein
MAWSVRLFAAACVALACRSEPLGPPADGRLRLLFIGNSLTLVHDLPGTVRSLALAAQLGDIEVESVVFPGYALEDHWSEGKARAAIERGGLSHVIMQQGPSALEESRANLIVWTKRFAVEIRKVGAVPALFAVWPESYRVGDLPRVIDSYRLAAEAVSGVFLPVGAAWQAVWEQDPTSRLYGPDGFHPSELGTYLAALTIVGRLYDRSAVGLPTRVSMDGVAVEIPPADALLLQHAADRANGRPGS